MAYLLRFDGTNDYVTLQNLVGGDFADRLDLSQEWVLEWKFKRSGSDGYVHRFFDYDGGSADTVIFRASDGLFRASFIAGQLYWSVTGVNTIDPVIFRIIKHGGVNEYELFVDYGDGNGFVSEGVRSNNVQIFNFNTIGRDGSTGYINGDLYYVSYTTTNSGVNFYANPSASSGTGSILPDTVGGNDGTLVNFPTDDSQWVFYDDGGGAVDYTITLASGGYSVSGNDLALLSERNLSLQNGSYHLTGTELNIAIQRSISLSDGIYTKNGANLSITTERLLGVDTGSYTYIGTDISLQYGRAFRLSLGQGTYSLQGTELGLLKDYVISLSSDSYSYNTDNISILADRRITTDSGNYAYTGSPINFIYETGGITYTLSIDSGSYNLTGSSLDLLTNRKLPIDFGEYTYEGVNSELLYNRVVALDSGIYSSSGTDLGIRVNRRLVFNNGNYSLQGTPITLSYSGEVLAILEGYNLSYKKHPVQSNYKTYNITAR